MSHKIIISNKQIVGLAVMTFIVLGVYKFISSGVQEGKEKEVLQEKYKLEQQAKEALNQCLTEVDSRLKSFESLMADAYKGINKPGEKEKCEQSNKAWALSHPDTYVYKPESCVMTLSDLITANEIRRQELLPERQECYKRYK